MILSLEEILACLGLYEQACALWAGRIALSINHPCPLTASIKAGFALVGLARTKTPQELAEMAAEYVWWKTCLPVPGEFVQEFFDIPNSSVLEPIESLYGAIWLVDPSRGIGRARASHLTADDYEKFQVGAWLYNHDVLPANGGYLDTDMDMLLPHGQVSHVPILR